MRYVVNADNPTYGADGDPLVGFDWIYKGAIVETHPDLVPDGDVPDSDGDLFVYKPDSTGNCTWINAQWLDVADDDVCVHAERLQIPVTVQRTVYSVTIDEETARDLVDGSQAEKRKAVTTIQAALKAAGVASE